MDLIRTRDALENCIMNSNCEWNDLDSFKPMSIDEYLSEETVKNRNLYYQKQTV